MIKIPRKTCYTRKPFQSYQNSRNLGYQNKRIKRFRNCLPYWSTNFRDRKCFFSVESGIYRWQSHGFGFLQLNLVFIADGFRSGLLWKYDFKVRSSQWNCSAKKMCSWISDIAKFCKFHGKTPVLKSCFNRAFRIATLFKSASNTGCFL